MRISNTNVYGLSSSVARSVYPMSIAREITIADIQNSYSRLPTVGKLGAAPSGSGHDCFLKGIIVQADFYMPQYWWQQAKRYGWFDIISSQSTMHRIGQLKIAEQCTQWTDPRAIKICQEYVDKYNHGDCCIDEVLSNVPQGLCLVVGITTNYLQLKTMYKQRKTHRLQGWNKVFKEWVEDLPYIEELGVI